MSEIDRIWDQLQRSFEGNEAWRCPSLRDLLARRQRLAGCGTPDGGRAQRLGAAAAHDGLRGRGAAAPRRRGRATLPDDEAWPVPAETIPAAWLQAKLAFGEARRALRQAVAAFPEERLSEPVPGREYTYYVLLHGASSTPSTTRARSRC